MNSVTQNALLGALVKAAIVVGVIIWAFWQCRNMSVNHGVGMPGGNSSISDTRFAGPTPVEKLEDRIERRDTSSARDVASKTDTKTDAKKTDETKTGRAANVAVPAATTAAIAPAKNERIGLTEIVGDNSHP